MHTCMDTHRQWTRGEGSSSKRWDELGVESSAKPSIAFPCFKEEFDSGSSVRDWVLVTRSFVCSRQAIRLSRFQSLPLASYISLWQFTVQCFIFSKKQTGAGPGGTPKQNTCRNVSLFLKIKPLNCHINKTTFQGRELLWKQSCADIWTSEGAHVVINEWGDAGAYVGKLLHDVLFSA